MVMVHSNSQMVTPSETVNSNFETSLVSGFRFQVSGEGFGFGIRVSGLG